jgi:transcriptional regulator with PAS, ATPase and Fis domain
VGSNAVARALFGLGSEAIGATRIEDLLDPPMQAWLDLACREPSVARRVERRDGARLWARVEASRLSVAPATRVPAPDGLEPAVPRVAALARRAAPGPNDDALGRLEFGDAAVREAARKARRVLDKPIPILLQGESGTGKELFARALHDSGARHGGPFVAVNCAALPESLIEAELFGYRAGAFTGAAREGAPGRIREAHGGTLFLDEIGDMPLALQARLLRVLQQREVVPLGGGKAVAVDFRLVCATHRQLRVEMDAGRFREDLYYRLNGLALHLPPLRERGDLAALVQHMVQALRPDQPTRIADGLADAWQAYRWPGNLRQLHNALATACALLDEGEGAIDWGHLPDDLAAELRESAGLEVREAGRPGVRETGRLGVREVVAGCDGNLSEVARRLGISRNTLYRRLRDAGMHIARDLRPGV